MSIKIQVASIEYQVARFKYQDCEGTLVLGFQLFAQISQTLNLTFFM